MYINIQKVVNGFVITAAADDDVRPRVFSAVDVAGLVEVLESELSIDINIELSQLKRSVELAEKDLKRLYDEIDGLNEQLVPIPKSKPLMEPPSHCSEVLINDGVRFLGVGHYYSATESWEFKFPVVYKRIKYYKWTECPEVD